MQFNIIIEISSDNITYMTKYSLQQQLVNVKIVESAYSPGVMLKGTVKGENELSVVEEVQRVLDNILSAQYTAIVYLLSLEIENYDKFFLGDANDTTR